MLKYLYGFMKQFKCITNKRATLYSLVYFTRIFLNQINEIQFLMTSFLMETKVDISIICLSQD